MRDLERQRRHGYYRNTVLGPASNHALDPDRLTHIHPHPPHLLRIARSKGSKGRNKRPKSTKPELPSEHDWRTTDAQEIDRRRQRARDEKMRIENLTPAQNVFSNFRVHSASGRDYQVEIRGIDPLECARDERAPIGGGPIQILVVSEHVAHARAPWMDSLRDEFFASLEGSPPSHQGPAAPPRHLVGYLWR